MCSEYLIFLEPAFLAGFIFVRAKKQPWSSSLCHSLVPHTIVDL